MEKQTPLIKTRYSFFTVPSNIWQVTYPDGSPLKMVAKAVYVYLWSRASREAKAFPSVPTIAKEITASTRAVQYAIRDLEALGLLEAEERFQDGRQTSNLYTLNIPDDARRLVSGRGAPGAPGGCKGCTDGGAQGAGEQDPQELDPSNNNSSVVVVEQYEKGTRLSDLSISTASKWIQAYGQENVTAKLRMLTDLIAAGRRIKSPQAWLAKALKEDWQPAADRDQARRESEDAKSRRIIEEAKAAESRAKDPAFRRQSATALREILNGLRA